MAQGKRRRHSPAFKCKVAGGPEGDLTIAELSSRFKLQSTPVQQWKKMPLDEGVLVFERGVWTAKSPYPHAGPNDLHRNLGDRTMERDLLQDKLSP